MRRAWLLLILLMTLGVVTCLSASLFSPDQSESHGHSPKEVHERRMASIQRRREARVQLEPKAPTIHLDKESVPPPGSIETVVVTIFEASGSLNDLENLVGNIHGLAPASNILVYGLRTPHMAAQRIRMWKRVTFISMEDRFLLSQHTNSKFFENPLLHPESNLHQNGRNTNNDLVSQSTTALLDYSNTASRWLPIVINDALQSMQHGRILYLTHNMVILEEKHFRYLESLIDQDKPILTKSADKHLSVSIMGFRAPAQECTAYRLIIEPMLHCLRSLCREQPPYIFCADNHLCRTEQSLPAGFSPIKPFDLNSLGVRNIKYSIDTPQDHAWFCRAQFREEGFHSLAKLTVLPVHAGDESLLETHMRAQRFIEPREGEVSIALGVPSRGITHDGKRMRLTDLPLLDPFLSTFLRTYAVLGTSIRWKFAILVAFDEGDPTYENIKLRQELQELMKTRIGPRPIEVHFFRFRDLRGSVTYLWNGLFEYAVDAGYDYFYQVNDDLSFTSRKWPLFLRNALMSNPVCPNLGVVGPKDDKNPRLMTQSMTHRTHFDIFGSYYPSTLRNWYSDDWMMQVYAGTYPSSTISLASATITNTQKSGTRYQVCRWNLSLLDGEVKKGRELIATWLQKNQEYCANLTKTVKERFPEVFRTPLRRNLLRDQANGQTPLT